MNTEEQTDSRCLSPTTPGHNHGARCRLPAYAGGYCKRHARSLGITKLCLTCGLWHEAGKHRKPARTE